MIKGNNKLNSGFIALTSMLVISAIVLFVSISISLLGVGEAKSSLDFKKGAEAFKIAKGCTEEALLRIKKDNTYTGTLTPLTVGNGNCTILVTGTGSNRNITVEAQVSDQISYVKRISIDLKLVAGSLNITSWSEY